MLTAHKYENVLDTWDEDTIKECCESNPTGKVPCTDCCYDKWQDELNDIISDLNIATEKSQQKQKEYDFVLGRRDRYKSWLDEIDKSDSQARDICTQLKLIATQIDQIWYNTNKAAEAIKILFCMIREILLACDNLKKICADLDNCISNNTDPLVTGGQGILVYYKDYKSKLDATVKTRDEIFKNLVDAVVMSNLISNTISTRDINSTDDPPYVPCDTTILPCTPLKATIYGFKTIICEWYISFNCDAPPCPPPNPCPPDTNTPAQTKTTAPTQTTGTGTTTPPDECKPDCELNPTFTFPICGNSYRGCVQKWVNFDNDELVLLAGELSEANILTQRLQACMTSLTNATKAVNPSGRCQ